MHPIDELFYWHYDAAKAKFEDADFKKEPSVDDWKRYVPEEIAGSWQELSEREQRLVFIMAQQQAGAI